MTNSYHVSVIIPAYNRANYIVETIESVFSGNEGLNIEVIVVDDGSTDDTLSVLERYKDRIKLITQKNQGAPAARNRGFLESTGKYIKFLDSDDILEPGFLTAQYNHLEKTGADVSYGDCKYLGDLKDPRSGQIIKASLTQDPLKSLLNDWWIPPFGYLFKSEAVAGIAWDKDYRCLQDFDFILRVAISGAKFVYLPGIMGKYRIGLEGQISGAKSEEYAIVHCKILDKIIEQLNGKNGLTSKRKQLIAENYWDKSQDFWGINNRAYKETVKKVYNLKPIFFPIYIKRRLLLKIMVGVLGIKFSEIILRKLRHIYG